MDYLTVDEVAARLKVTTLTVRRWLQAGSLGGIGLGDRVACRIGAKDLEAFIDARRRGGVQERAKRQPLALLSPCGAARGSLRPSRQGCDGGSRRMNEDPVLAQRRNQAGRDQVRVAFGAVPVVLETFPESDPVRVEIRERARAMLVARGHLTADELAKLPEKVAITVVLERLRGDAFRAGMGHVCATRSERRLARSAVG